jgi:signal transduction histidine kinase/CheY-like chemotaxis protein
MAGVWLAVCAPAIARPNATVDPWVDQRVMAARTILMSNPQGAMQAASDLRRDIATRVEGEARQIDLAAADWITAAAQIGLNQPQSALKTLAPTLDIVRRIAPDTSLRGELMLAHGSAAAILGQIQLTLADYQQAYEIFGRAKAPRGQAVALQHIAATYFNASDYESALKYGEQSVEIYSDDPMLLLSGYNNRGNALIKLGRYREAAVEYGRAFEAARKLNSPLLQVRILQNLAEAQADAGDYALADQTLARGYAMARSGPAAAWRPALDGIGALVAFRRHQLAIAETLIERTFTAPKEAQASMPMMEFHQTAYNIYRALGDDSRALPHLEAFKKLDDEQRALAASTNAALMQARFDFANQNSKIDKLTAGEARAQATIANARARFLFALLAGAGLVLVLLLIGFISIRRSRDQVRAANASLSTTNKDLAKALAAKTEFLATTSHEIRTPLNGILGMTQVILADKAVGPALRSRIELVHGAGETMRALVDDILDVAKMETGELRIHPAEMNLTRLLRDAATVWAGQAETKKIGITLDIDEAPAAIIADEVRLRQIVFNLMSNAIKFTDRGQVRLTATAVERDQGEHLRIDVQDSGIGIPPDRLEEIFESFRQVDGGTTRRHGGTGLGLTICRSLARAMGGEIDVASTLGAGSTFTIDIPLVRAVLPVVEIADERTEVDSLATAELLLIEANPLSQGILRALLTPKVRALHIVADPGEGLRVIDSGSIDHILADGGALGLDLAVADGLAVAAAAQRAHLSILWPTPDADVKAAIEAAGVQLIAKPITAPELLNALEMIYRPHAASHGIAA